MADRKELLKGLAQGRVENRGQLDKDRFRVKGDPAMADATEPTTRIRGAGTDRIDTKEIAEIGDADIAKQIREQPALRRKLSQARKAGDVSTMKKIQQIAAKLGKGASTGLKALPIIGGLAAAVGSEDASAAIPGLGAAEDLGKGSDTLEGFDIADPEQDEARMRAMARKMALQNKLMRGE